MTKRILALRSFLPGVSRVFSNSTPLFIVLVLSKFLDLNELGELNYLLAIITLIGVLTDFGLPEAVQTFLPQSKDKRELGGILLAEFAVVSGAALLFFTADALLAGALSKGYTGILSLIIFFSASNTVILTFNGLRQNGRLVFYMIGNALLLMALTLLLYLYGLDATYAFLLARLISWIAFTLIPILDLTWQKLLVLARPTPAVIKFAVNIFLLMVSYAILNQWDAIVVTNTLGEAANGVFKSVSMVGASTNAIAVIVATYLLPQFSQLVAERKMKQVKTTLNRYSYVLILLIPIFLILYLFVGDEILAILFNSEIAAAGAQYLPVITSGSLIYVVATPGIQYLTSIRKTNYLQTIHLAVMVLYIFGSYLAVYSLGMMGVAISYLLANLALLGLVVEGVFRNPPAAVNLD